MIYEGVGTLPESFDFSTEQSLETLIGHIAKGNGNAMNRFYDLTGSRVFGISLRILKEPSLAEEAALDSFVKIWKQALHFNHKLGCALVWIDTIVRNSALDLLRKEARKTRIKDLHRLFSTDDGKQVDDPEHQAGLNERAVKVRKVLGNLAQEYRIPLFAAYFEGMSHSQIAEALGQPLGTVKTRIRKGLSILRGELAQLKSDL